MNEEVKGGAGSTVESWLEEEGLLEEANAAAIKSVLAWQLREEMRTRGITKTRMAELLHSSRTQVDRILDPDNVGEAVELSPYAVDVASGVESAPGIKDHDQLRRFIRNAKSAR